MQDAGCVFGNNFSERLSALLMKLIEKLETCRARALLEGMVSDPDSPAWKTGSGSHLLCYPDPDPA